MQNPVVTWHVTNSTHHHAWDPPKTPCTASTGKLPSNRCNADAAPTLRAYGTSRARNNTLVQARCANLVMVHNLLEVCTIRLPRGPVLQHPTTTAALQTSKPSNDHVTSSACACSNKLPPTSSQSRPPPYRFCQHCCHQTACNSTTTTPHVAVQQHNFVVSSCSPMVTL